LPFDHQAIETPVLLAFLVADMPSADPSLAHFAQDFSMSRNRGRVFRPRKIVCRCVSTRFP